MLATIFNRSYTYCITILVQVSRVFSTETQAPIALPVRMLAIFLTAAESALPLCSSGSQTCSSRISTANLPRERGQRQQNNRTLLLLMMTLISHQCIPIHNDLGTVVSLSMHLAESRDTPVDKLSNRKTNINSLIAV